MVPLESCVWIGWKPWGEMPMLAGMGMSWPLIWMRRLGWWWTAGPSVGNGAQMNGSGEMHAGTVRSSRTSRDARNRTAWRRMERVVMDFTSAPGDIKGYGRGEDSVGGPPMQARPGGVVGVSGEGGVRGDRLGVPVQLIGWRSRDQVAGSARPSHSCSGSG